MAATTASSLEVEQDSGNIDKTRSKATLNEPNPQGTGPGSGPRCQETVGDTIAQTGFENVSKLSNDPLLARDLSSLGDYKFKKEGQETREERRVKTSWDKNIIQDWLSKRVKSSKDKGINLVSTHFDADTDMFGVHDLVGDEAVVEIEVASKDVNLNVDEVTLAQALAALKSAKPKADKVMLQEPEHGTITTTTAATTVTATSIRPKAKGLVIHEQEQAPTPTVSSQQPSQLSVQDKSKDKMVKQEHVKKLSKKDQLMLDEELAFKLQAKEEDERLAR
ncbi:hypothetical protein Tco_0250428 [Tanacetum coccineum]